MTQKDIIFMLVSLAIFVGVSLFSYAGYQSVLLQAPIDISQRQQGQDIISNVLAGMTIDSLNQEIALSEFQAIERRNPFERFVPQVKIVPKPVRLSLPKINVEPRKVEPEPKKIEEIYFYRGVVILGNKKTYVLERERDKKTFFVNKGDKTKDFTVLETSEKEVVIVDNEDNIKVLKVLT